jgi:hypothetical protein
VETLIKYDQEVGYKVATEREISVAWAGPTFGSERVLVAQQSQRRAPIDRCKWRFFGRTSAA